MPADRDKHPGRTCVRPFQVAFTLVELLVVISVIAILASLLLTALNQARAAADSAACQANVRQIGLGARMYQDDFRFYVPWETSYQYSTLAEFYAAPPESAIGPLLDSDTGGIISRSWVPLLEPYVGARFPSQFMGGMLWPTMSPTPSGPRSVWICPGFKRVFRGRLWPGYGSGSYGYNVLGVNGIRIDYPARQGPKVLGVGGHNLAWQLDFVRPVHENEVTLPSDTIEFGDAPLGVFSRGDKQFVYGNQSLGLALNIEYNPLTASTVNWGPGGPQVPAAVQAHQRRHRGRWNLEFCDGHVESLRSEALLDMRKAQQRARWNRDHLPHPEITGP